MNTKGFLLLIVTVVVIGGSIGGAFTGGLAVGRAQSDDAVPETAFLQQRFGGGQISGEGFQSDGRPGGAFTGGGLQGGQTGGSSSNGFPSGGEGQSSEDNDAPTGIDAGAFGAGAFGGRGGFGGILTGTVSTVDGNVFTVTTDTGETQVNLEDGSTIQVYAEGTASDLSSGDRVLVIVSGDIESGEPVSAVSVVVNPPEGGGIFGGGFGGRQFEGRQRTP